MGPDSVQTRGLHRNAPQRLWWTSVCLQGTRLAVNARCRLTLLCTRGKRRAGLRCWCVCVPWAGIPRCSSPSDPPNSRADTKEMSGMPTSRTKAPLNSFECSSHPCCVSFAGGKKDPWDRTVVDTALREAREELGIHVTEDKVWGVLKPLRDMVSAALSAVKHSMCDVEFKVLSNISNLWGISLETYFTQVSECRPECESQLWTLGPYEISLIFFPKCIFFFLLIFFFFFWTPI